MKKILTLLFIAVILSTIGCQEDSPNEIYYPFNNEIWQRFNILSFELSIEKADKPYKIVLFARHNKDFPFKALDFNMVMNTPSGEERINEYRLKVKNRAGEFLGSCENEICEATIVLKKEIYITKSGLLLIELENLTPRLETPGLLGVGVRLEKR